MCVGEVPVAVDPSPKDHVTAPTSENRSPALAESDTGSPAVAPAGTFADSVGGVASKIFAWADPSLERLPPTTASPALSMPMNAEGTLRKTSKLSPVVLTIVDGATAPAADRVAV